jgi:purine-cytosine permease-like protein
MLIVTGVLIIIGGIMSATSAAETENPTRMMGEGGSLVVIGAIIAVLGAIKIRKSKISVS